LEGFVVGEIDQLQLLLQIPQYALLALAGIAYRWVDQKHRSERAELVAAHRAERAELMLVIERQQERFIDATTQVTASFQKAVEVLAEAHRARLKP
jgi:hypothetical protein